MNKLNKDNSFHITSKNDSNTSKIFTFNIGDTLDKILKNQSSIYGIYKFEGTLIVITDPEC